MHTVPKKIKIADGLKIVDRTKRIDVHVSGGESITLNDTASDFFRVLQTTQDYNAIIDKMAKDYDVDRNELIEDSLELLEYLLKYKVISYDNIKENYSALNFHKEKIEKVLLPVGAYEQHGRHNPLGTDYLVADKLAESLSERTGIYKLPPVVFGCSALHLEYPGTVSIQKSTYVLYISDIIDSLILSGVRILYIVNGHGGNIGSLEAVKEKYKDKIEIKILNWWIIGRELNQFKPDEYHHAGSLETSMVLSISEKYVDTSQYVDTEVIEYDPYQVKSISELTPCGSIGVVSTASRERGIEYTKGLLELIIEKYI